MSESGRETLRISGSGREALPDVWEWSEGPHECLGVVGRPSRMSGSGQEALSDIQEWSEALSNVRELSGGPPECL